MKTDPTVHLDLKQWGNSLGLRIPAAIARHTGLKVNQRVQVRAEDGRVIVTPEPDGTESLQQRLARFDPERHAGEAMATAPLGAERW